MAEKIKETNPIYDSLRVFTKRVIDEQEDILLKALEPFGVNRDNFCELFYSDRLEIFNAYSKVKDCTSYEVYLDGKNIVEGSFRYTMVEKDGSYRVECTYQIEYPNGKPGEGDNNE